MLTWKPNSRIQRVRLGHALSDQTILDMSSSTLPCYITLPFLRPSVPLLDRFSPFPLRGIPDHIARASIQNWPSYRRRHICLGKSAEVNDRLGHPDIGNKVDLIWISGSKASAARQRLAPLGVCFLWFSMPCSYHSSILGSPTKNHDDYPRAA
jgi:hypothetical protein